MRIRNVIIISIAFLIIILSFIIPSELIQIQDTIMRNEIYKRGRIEGKIDIQAEKIYLVKAIHVIGSNIQISNANKIQTVEVADTYNDTIYNVFENELKKLENYNILDTKEKSSDKYINIGVLDKKYLNREMEVTINCIEYESGNTRISTQMENKTGKVIYIMFNKDKILSDNKENIMRNYIKYLELYIIDDWKFENDILKSEKAQLTVSLLENGKTYELSIHSINKSSNFKYYKAD